MRRLGSCVDVLAGKLALVLCAQVMGQIVLHEVRPVGVIAVEAVGFAESVVHGGVERAGRDQCAERRNGLGQVQPLRNLGGRFEILRLERPVEVDGMAEFLVIAR